jgi:23S rRNA (cytidine1920-2'-O)/16S rRNA (cytidine1409-2'-O)-methyltransferase
VLRDFFLHTIPPDMKPKATRKRLDVLLVERGLAESPQKALAMILAGEVQVNGQRAKAAGDATTTDARIELNSRAQKYVGRGGLKLEGALQDFAVSVAGRVCLDVGSSTGGFTDCLLQCGAAGVYAVDVNIAQLAWNLQQDKRVIRVERNARELLPSDIPELADLVVMDVSFISVAKILAPALACARRNAELLVLVKPQFELGREEIGEGGIVADRTLHEKAISQVRAAGEAAGIAWLGVQPSKLTGAEGNQEYFLHGRKKPQE